jgi:predicted metalloprotease with PDZ domain
MCGGANVSAAARLHGSGNFRTRVRFIIPDLATGTLTPRKIVEMPRSLGAALVGVLLTVMTLSGQSRPAAPVAPPNNDPIRYILRFPAPQTHYVEVEASYPTGGQAQIELFMAVWTPGSYLIREYQRHVEAVVARNNGGTPLTVVKSAKNRWRVATSGAPRVTVSYRVYGREMTVRNNWIESGFAMLNGAPTFISLVDGLTRPHEVRIELPAAWKTSATALMPAASPHSYRAEDFDTLVDSPIILGNPVMREFTVAGKPHYLVLEGDAAFFDADRAIADLQKIVEAGGNVFGNRFDYPHYYFLNMVTEAGGGLEHKNSFLGMSSRFTTRTPRAYRAWLGLLAHEYFHNWNVKRLRPTELGPFDYEKEVHSKSLWIGEGFTDYYAGVLVKRAGLASRDEYLEELTGQIEAVQNTPGRLVTAVDMASYDTWIKQYRPDENTANTSVNYYPKGAVIAFLLDARIRRATNGKQSLDDAMRLAYGRYSGAKGYTLEQFYQTMGEVAGTNLRPFFATAAESTEELNYKEALDWFGLRFRPEPRSTRAWLGASTRNDSGRLIVTSLRRETPAYASGLNVDDEILAVDNVRVRADGLAARLEQYKPNDKIELLVARRDRLVRVELTLGAEPGRPYRLEVDPDASEAQKYRLIAWIGQ